MGIFSAFIRISARQGFGPSFALTHAVLNLARLALLPLIVGLAACGGKSSSMDDDTGGTAGTGGTGALGGGTPQKIRTERVKNRNNAKD